MSQKQQQQAQGHVQCSVVDPATGSVVKEYPRQKNLILNQGLDAVATDYWASLFVYAAAGTGTTPTVVDSGTLTAAQFGTNVTLSGSVFTDTATDAGKVIKWDTNETAMVVTVLDPTAVTVNNSGTVAADEFRVFNTNQMGLAAELKRTNNYLTGSPYTDSELIGNNLVMRRTYDFTEESVTVDYSEIALGWDTGPTDNFARILLAAPVTVLPDQQLRVVYELTVEILPAANSAETAAIGGWPVAPAVTTNGTQATQFIGLAYVDTNGNAQPNYDAGFTANEPSQLSSVGIFVSADGTAPNAFGSSVNRVAIAAVAATGTYTAGNYYVDKTALFDTSTGNGTDIFSMGYGYHNPNLFSAGSNTTLVFVFDEAQTKENTRSLGLTWRFSWTRSLS